MPKPGSTLPTAAGLSEDGRVGGDREVAHHVQHVAAADGVAVHHRDHWLRDVADHAVQRVHVHRPIGRVPRRPSIAAVASFLLIAAGAECLVAGAGQHHDADVRSQRRREGVDQLLTVRVRKALRTSGRLMVIHAMPPSSRTGRRRKSWGLRVSGSAPLRRRRSRVPIGRARR